MSDQANLKIAEAVILNTYGLAIALAIGVAFGAAWALIPLLLGVLIVTLA
jgi:hypothetical protein